MGPVLAPQSADSIATLPDISYGVYIYAFPLQQTVVALVPGITVAQLLLLSSLATLGCAILSWHLVEERALAFKDRLPRRAVIAT